MAPKKERVQITLHAQKLKNVAGAFKGTSDPYAIVTVIANEPGDQPKVLGKTEVIKNSLSPHWTANFLADFEFSKPVRINVGVYDEVRKAKNHLCMGTAVFEVGEVLGAPGNIKAKKLKNGGTIFCRIKKAPARDTGTFHFHLRGIKLKNVDGLFGKSDPFFEISKQVNVGGGPSWQVVYRSEVIQNNLNPIWKAASVSINDICDGDKNKSVMVSVFDWDKKGKHAPMGVFETSVNGLISKEVHCGSSDPKTIDLSRSFILKKRGTPFGNIVVAEARVEGGQAVPATTSSAPSGGGFAHSLMSTNTNSTPVAGMAAVGASEVVPMAPPVSMAHPASSVERPSFIDYVSGGLELQLSVAVDFTGSNGDPRIPGTLHYIDRATGQLNHYEKALTAVGEIVGKYDSDQKFPMFGFGAKFAGIVRHCFQLGPTPEVSGIKGMIDAYRCTFQSGFIMSGPTVFAEVIQQAAAQARSKQEAARRIGQQAYHIHLILTDGAVTDIGQTREAIRQATDAPLSIVIVGIGNADFSAMQFLDDFQSQDGGGGRDICQFVEFQKYQHNKIQLTQATLDEIPDQVVDYFYGRNIKPLPPVSGSRLQLVPDEYNGDDEIMLSYDVNEDGEINLASGGYMDDTVYDDYNAYAGMTPMPPPVPHVAGAEPVFHVQVPPGVTAGQQLQIQHPQTQQPMIISVPPGVPPGGTFAVPY